MLSTAGCGVAPSRSATPGGGGLSGSGSPLLLVDDLGRQSTRATLSITDRQGKTALLGGEPARLVVAALDRSVRSPFPVPVSLNNYDFRLVSGKSAVLMRVVGDRVALVKEVPAKGGDGGGDVVGGRRMSYWAPKDLIDTFPLLLPPDVRLVSQVPDFPYPQDVQAPSFWLLPDGMGAHDYFILGARTPGKALKLVSTDWPSPETVVFRFKTVDDPDSPYPRVAVYLPTGMSDPQFELDGRSLEAATITTTRGDPAAPFDAVVRIPRGEGEGKITAKPVTGGSQVGPESFNVESDGSFLILDSARKAILRYKEGKLTTALDLGATGQPKDFTGDADGVFYVLGTAKVYRFSEGRLDTTFDIPQDDRAPIKPTGLRSLGDGDVHLRFFGWRGEYCLKDRKFMEPPDNDFRINGASISRGLVDFATVEGEGRRVQTTIEGVDKEGNLYVSFLDLDPQSSLLQAFRYLIVYDPEGRLTGRVLLPADVGFAPTWSFRVTPDGKVYYLVAEKEEIVIYLVRLVGRVEPLRKFFP